MLMIDKTASQVLHLIADALLAEVLAFGKLAIIDDIDLVDEGPLRINRYIEHRRLPITLLFLTLEQEANLQFSGENIPFRFNQATWPEETPLAGYTSSASLLPSQFIESLFSNWRQDAMSSKEGRFYRVFRSALWVSLHQGVAEGIKYLFDLLEAGGAFDCQAVALTAVYLLAARSQTNSDQEMVDHLVEGGTPKTRPEWLIFYPTLDWLQLNQLSDDMRGIILSLVERGIQRVEQIRNSSDLDAWITCYSSLAGLLLTIFLVVRWTHQEPPLSLRAVLSQFEEIVGDEHALRACIEMGTFAEGLDYARDIANQYRSTIGKGWEQRLQRERLLVPVQLHSLLLTDNDEQLPPDWILPSWRIAYPWTFLDTDEPDPMAIFSKFADGKIPKDSEIVEPNRKQRRQQILRGLDRAEKMINRGNTEKGLSQLHQLLRQYPWNFPILFDLGSTYYIRGDAETAFDYLIRAIVLGVTQPTYWEYLSTVLREIGNNREAAIASLLGENFTTFASEASDQKSKSQGNESERPKSNA
jgi:hypothetical protein